MVNMLNRKGALDIQAAMTVAWRILVFLMIFVPRTAEVIKIIVLGTLILLSVAYLFCKGSIRINHEVSVFFVLHSLYAIPTGLIGLLRGNPGAQGFLQVNVLYYLAFFLTFLSFSKIDSYKNIIGSMVIGAGAVSIYSILLFGVEIGAWPERLFLYFDTTSNVGIHEGFTHLVNTNLSMQIFLWPFLTTLYSQGYVFSKTKGRLLLAVLVLGAFAMLVSGRRILWIGMAIGLIYNLVVGRYAKASHRWYKLLYAAIIVGLLLLSVSVVPHLSPSGLINRAQSVIEGGMQDVRVVQVLALWRGFLYSPLIGSGAGAGVDDVIRNPYMPWTYEMTYSLVLFNSGLLGFLFFAASHIWLLFCLSKERRKSVIAEALFLAYLVVLFASGTNPYFTSSFDFLWFSLLPVLYFQVRKRERHELL